RGGDVHPREDDSRSRTKLGIGTLRLVGTRAIARFPLALAQIQRVRLLTRANGYYGQLAVQADRTLPHPATTHAVGIELGLKEFLLGLKEFLSTSDGATVANPRSLRQAERKRKRLPRQVSRNRSRANRNGPRIARRRANAWPEGI